MYRSALVSGREDEPNLPFGYQGSFQQGTCKDIRKLKISFQQTRSDYGGVRKCQVLVAVTVVQLSQLSGNQSVHLSMVGKRNQTGHLVTRVLFSEEPARTSHNWKVDFQQSRFEFGGVRKFQVLGAMTVPPKRPLDYVLFPGIGYYKFHTNVVVFQEASSICMEEGGHLAIINSEAEAAVMSHLVKKYDSSGKRYAAIGFYDPNKDRKFFTIFGEPLNQTGYLKWHSGQPNGPTSDFCGYVHEDGTLGDLVCSEKLCFICEYDLSWDLM